MNFTENDVKLLAILRATIVVAKAEPEKNDALIKSIEMEIQGLISRMENEVIKMPDNISEKFNLDDFLNL